MKQLLSNKKFMPSSNEVLSEFRNQPEKQPSVKSLPNEPKEEKESRRLGADHGGVDL